MYGRVRKTIHTCSDRALVGCFRYTYIALYRMIFVIFTINFGGVIGQQICVIIILNDRAREPVLVHRRVLPINIKPKDTITATPSATIPLFYFLPKNFRALSQFEGRCKRVSRVPRVTRLVDGSSALKTRRRQKYNFVSVFGIK